MKHGSKYCTSGYVSLPIVTGLAIMFSLSLTMLFKSTLMNRDQASKTQLRVDYRQREEALMRALIATFPSKAIASMKANHGDGPEHSWSTIFAEAVRLSSSSQRLSPQILQSLNLRNKLSGDVGDHSSTEVRSWITSLTGEPGRVTPGTMAYAEVFAQPAFAGKVPPLLSASSDLQTADALRPVVSPLKRYASQVPGLMADVTLHRVYNLIAYPNIRFGYAAPGELFVAKRNWWAFTINYGSSQSTVARHYVLSLYEVPSQMPIEASAFAAIGTHQDGTAWNSDTVTIDGAVYAGSMSVAGTYGAARLAGRSRIDMTDEVTLGGLSVGADFDAMGERERLQAERGTDALPVALSANSGRLTFLPLPTGNGYLRRSAPDTTLNAFEEYTAGGQKCRITVEATDMVSIEDQTPTALRIRFPDTAGAMREVVLKRGSNWPTAFEPGGPGIPFQTELTNNNRSCLTFYPSLLDPWLQTNGAASVASNNSLHFGVNPSLNPLNVRVSSDPPAIEDMCVIIRRGKNLTNYTKGLSIVAPLRVYVGDDLNAIPAAAVPAGSGLATGSTFYPPLSIFSAELRVGTTAFNRPIEHHGQLGSLATGTTNAWQPLDMKSGSDDAVHSDSISANLKPLRSPAELPPVHPMNWLVVIEEISQN
ncbi:hypothetical protein [Brevifollis gellanilyticus]|uniref:Uncharacterized protein n=1 Tax=Brevifollis gellanilyticus TaxID=748831 RepID=A0A512M6G6_9BACT|nr:hypothetical protein [Brevifollis gellanilyticus]GEP42326.1 hypothetical protein BGE01nite_16170 [Brevifollis gellanilyticus]